ncbi:hypothetical protein [Nocardioides sp. B-3]|uniref:hypothetical protein n=1 Tax=Nocardioides sp. B-3 TaxID=2895565 RepID=UPI00215263B4|nr:hypothetical protein [Nocardioides sp. B-3]UUZ57956.1 hypothetical protein LP418_16635 [Nocardioides sp. B-3]
MSLHVGSDAGEFLRRQRAVHLARMRELVALQSATADADEQIAVDHTISHLDADLRWLDTAAARVAARRKVRP